MGFVCNKILYVDSVQQIITDIGAVTALNNQYSDDRFDNILLGRAKALAELSENTNAAEGEMETQTTVLETLFQIKLDPLLFVMQVDNPKLGKVKFTERGNYLAELNSELKTYRNEELPIFRTENRPI
jgi:hypothetical protein